MILQKYILKKNDPKFRVNMKQEKLTSRVTTPHPIFALLDSQYLRRQYMYNIQELGLKKTRIYNLFDS